MNFIELLENYGIYFILAIIVAIVIIFIINSKRKHMSNKNDAYSTHFGGQAYQNSILCKCRVKMTKNAHLKCTIMSEELAIRIIKDFSAFDAVGIACNFDNFAVMNQTVNNGVCDDSVTKHMLTHN